MLIHFAFWSKKESVGEQLALTHEHILGARRLKISECPEFLPFLPAGNISRPKSVSWKETEKGTDIIVTFRRQAYRDISYMPRPVRMVCFTKISFNDLKNSVFSAYYGRLGLVFNKGFEAKYKPQQVRYYTEENLIHDKLVKRLNELYYKYSNSLGEKEELKKLEQEVLTFRKPKHLFANFGKPASAEVNVKREKPYAAAVVTISNYDRYPMEYNFSREAEWRIAFDDNSRGYLDFSENDIYQVIVPDEESKAKTEKFLTQHYSAHPKVVIFPI